MAGPWRPRNCFSADCWPCVKAAARHRGGSVIWRVGAFLDSLATPWLWPPSEPWCLRRVLAHGPVSLDGLECRPSGGGLLALTVKIGADGVGALYPDDHPVISGVTVGARSPVNPTIMPSTYSPPVPIGRIPVSAWGRGQWGRGQFLILIHKAAKATPPSRPAS